MNMIRVWGGGIYEDDIFYDLCDENGILVWQDFTFACSVYPLGDKMKENIRQEAKDNIRRLRNHASLALWCGNNEIMDAIFNWGWMEKYKKENPEHFNIILKQYFDLFHELLPEAVAEHNPETYYLPTSPFNDMKAHEARLRAIIITGPPGSRGGFLFQHSMMFGAVISANMVFNLFRRSKL